MYQCTIPIYFENNTKPINVANRQNEVCWCSSKWFM